MQSLSEKGLPESMENFKNPVLLERLLCLNVRQNMKFPMTISSTHSARLILPSNQQSNDSKRSMHHSFVQNQYSRLNRPPWWCMIGAIQILESTVGHATVGLVRRVVIDEE